MSAQTIAAQIQELVGSTSIASLDDWCRSASNKLTSLLPYEFLAPFTSLETETYVLSPASTPVTAKNKRIFEVSIQTPSSDSPTVVLDTSWSASGLNITGFTGMTTAYVGGFFVGTDSGGSRFRRTITAYVSSTSFTIDVALFDDGAGTNGYIIPAQIVSTTSTKRVCSFVSPQEYITKYLDSNSMFYPTIYDPVWTIYSDAVKASPIAVGTIISVRDITFNTTFDSTKTTLSGAGVYLPETCAYLVVLDVAQRVIENKLAALALSALSATYIKPVLDSLPSLPAEIDVSGVAAIATLPVAPAYTYSDATAASVSATTIAALGTVPVYVAPSIPVLDYSGVDTELITNEDIELGLAKLKEVETKVSEYGARLQDSAKTYEALTVAYQNDAQKKIKQGELTLQEALQNAKLTTDISAQNKAKALEKDIALYADQFRKYLADIERYKSQIQATIETQQSKIVRFQQAYIAVIAKYTAEQQNESYRVTGTQKEYELNVTRVGVERDKLILQLRSLKQQYDEGLLMSFGINLSPVRSKDNGE